MIEHPEAWSFGRYELDGIPIEGLTYFRIEAPQPASVAAMRQQLRAHFAGPSRP